SNRSCRSSRCRASWSWRARCPDARAPPSTGPTVPARVTGTGSAPPRGVRVPPDRLWRPLSRSPRRLPAFGAEDGDRAHERARLPAEVVRERLRPPVLHLALTSFAAQLEPRLEDHPQARRADRMAEALQPAVGVHRQVAVEVEAPVEHVLPRLAALG